MIIGIPKEIKDQECRVSATPSAVMQMVGAGHTVLVETNAGAGIGRPDEDYELAGAEIVEDAAKLWESSDFIYKVKEPGADEYKYMRKGQIIFCYLHVAADEPLLNALLESGAVGIAYETIEEFGNLPLLKPMSEIGGCMGVIEGANLLQTAKGGKGRMLQGLPGVPPGHVVIIGAGVAGTGAIRTAVGIGARVTVIGRNVGRLAQLQDIFGPRLETLYSNAYNIEKAVKSADIVIGAVLVTGARAPKLVTEEMVKAMQPGSVIVDISVDQGGCVETIDRVTTHSDPTYMKHGIVHYAVANIPGTVARTASLALSNVTTSYALEIADKGWEAAARDNPGIAKGINTALGKVTFKAVAEAFGRDYTSIYEMI